jgi:hypothetical protein
VLSMFPSIRHQSHQQSHGKKLWSNSDSLKCNKDLNHVQGVSAKEEEKEMSTRFIK